MLAGMYRDEGEAARLRIETLEAKLAERDAAIAARDAEISELTAHVERLGSGGAAGPRARRSWPILAGAMALLVGGSSVLLSGMRPRAQVGSAHHRVEPKTTTGVAACDEYLFRVELCISRLDPAVRDPLSTSLRATREAWWLAGTTPGGQEQLAATCQQALDGLAMSPLCE
jgi:hypothetical protein